MTEVEVFDFVPIPLSVEVIVFWVCGYPSSVEVIVVVLGFDPSCVKVIVILALCLLLCRGGCIVGERSCALLVCIYQILSGDSLCGRSCVDL